MNIIDIAKACGAIDGVTDDDRYVIDFTESALTALESRIRADERERAAKLCDLLANGWKEHPSPDGCGGYIALSNCAAAIRNSVHSDAAPVAEPESMNSHLTDGDGSQVQAL